MRVKGESYVVCLSNKGYRVALVVRKIYRCLPDREAEKRGLVCVIDESGEDYLFPARLFAPLSLSEELRSRLATAS